MGEEYLAVYLFLQANGLQFYTFTNEKLTHIKLVILGLDRASDVKPTRVPYQGMNSLRLHKGNKREHPVPVEGISAQMGTNIVG